MLGIRLEPELDRRLSRLAQKTGRTKSHYAREAIRNFLEDREDYLHGIAVLERHERRHSLAQVRKELGLDA